MGSHIEVLSEPNRGSAFWFELRLPIVTAADQPSPRDWRTITGYAGPRRTILVADDKLDNRLVLLNLLEPLGFVVHLAEDGRAALDLAWQQRPDLVVMDLVMPIMTGFSAIQAMRTAPELAGLPIVAVSASVFEPDQQRARVAGSDAFLPKPIQADKLLALLSDLLRVDWVMCEPAPPQPPSTRPAGPA